MKLTALVALALTASQPYTRTIDRASKVSGVPADLVRALVTLESSWRPKARSGAHWGLGQLRVSATARPQYLGRQRELFEPHLNLRLTVRALSYWKAYHATNCRGARHPYWSHYQHGTKVRSLGSGRRVGRLYRAIKARRRARGTTLYRRLNR